MTKEPGARLSTPCAVSRCKLVIVKYSKSGYHQSKQGVLPATANMQALIRSGVKLPTMHAVTDKKKP